MNDAIILSILGAIGVAALGVVGNYIGHAIKDWQECLNKNTVQVALLNDKFEFFIDRIESLEEDVDQLKMWRAKADPEWK